MFYKINANASIIGVSRNWFWGGGGAKFLFVPGRAFKPYLNYILSVSVMLSPIYMAKHMNFLF